MTYQLTLSDMIFRLEDEVYIPLDPANCDYQAYLAWLREGNEPAPALDLEPVPEPTPEEKLATSGLTVDELKQLLGL